MARRVAKEMENGFYINLGIGLPTLVSSAILSGKTIIFQAENGILGQGSVIMEGEGDQDFDMVNASNRPISLVPGASLFDLVESFAMIRGRHLDCSVLGALQVSEKGDLANWMIPGRDAGGIGGAMDLALGAKQVMVMMMHTDKEGKPRILKKCTLPLTAKECVKTIFTDIAVIKVKPDGLLLKEHAPGWTVDEIQALTEPTLKIASDLKEIQIQ
jgi:3-oxoacid CoA-transferase subunit B